MEKVGNVIIDYSYYTNSDYYSDGLIEDSLLNYAMNGKINEALSYSNDWATLYHFSSIRENIIEWFPLKKDDSVLEIGSGCGALTGILSSKAGDVTCVELSKKRSLINAYRNKDKDNIKIVVGNFQDIEPNLPKYDVITLIGVWEYSGIYIDSKEPYKELLRLLKSHLNENGNIIIAIENKMGLKYWNGALEDHILIQYAGLNGYVNGEKVKTFSKSEIIEILNSIGIDKYSFYYPYPDYKLPMTIFSDEVMPKVGQLRDFKKNYSNTQVYNFNSATVSDQVCLDGIFDYFSNSFLICIGEIENDIRFAKYNNDRQQKYDVSTYFYFGNNEKKVIKKALNEAARVHLENIFRNTTKCNNNIDRVKCSAVKLDGNILTEPYYEGTSLADLLYLYRSDYIALINIIKEYIELYMKPADKSFRSFTYTEEFGDVFGEEYPCEQMSLDVTNIDGIFQNMIKKNNGDIVMIDSEWVFEFPIPYEFVIWRAVYNVYINMAAYLCHYISKNRFCVECGINENNIKIYENMEHHFQKYVFGDKSILKRYEKPALMQNVKIWE